MNLGEFTGLTLAGSFIAGLVGALSGLGGGVVIVPLLTLALGVDFRYAIGASLVSVIATSSGAAAAYVREGFTNLRVGMFLEIATTFGAIFTAVLASKVPVAVPRDRVRGRPHHLRLPCQLRRADTVDVSRKPDRIAQRLRMDSSYPLPGGGAGRVPGAPHPGGLRDHVCRPPAVRPAGASAGTGALKVLAMDLVMRLPLKVSTTTSNFMIGVTAAASAGIYLHRGYIDPAIAMPVMLGVLGGSLIGARYLPKVQVRSLRLFFVVVIFALGVEMVFSGVTGRIR